MAIPVRIRRNADGTIIDITLCPKQEDIYAELAKVKQQLAIAVEALEDVLAADTYTSIYAEKALQQIKELNNEPNE